MAEIMGPEMVPIEAFVGIISDEIEALRKRGKTDSEIALLIEENSAIRISPQDIILHYATPEDWRHHNE